MSHSCPGGIKTIKGKQLNANHFPFSKSGYQDSNLGPPAPKAGALTGLRYTPFCNSLCLSLFAVQRYAFILNYKTFR